MLLARPAGQGASRFAIDYLEKLRMAIRQLRCGTSREILGTLLPAAETRETWPPPRLVTTLHLTGLIGSYRVVAELADGREVLLWLAESYQSALASVRTPRRIIPVPERLRLDHWIGSPESGHWEMVLVPAGKLTPAHRRTT